jgi:hypothetical protein
LIATTTGPGTIGNAGSVKVSAGTILVSAGAEIASSTGGHGTGGDVTVNGSEICCRVRGRKSPRVLPATAMLDRSPSRPTGC